MAVRRVPFVLNARSAAVACELAHIYVIHSHGISLVALRKRDSILLLLMKSLVMASVASCFRIFSCYLLNGKC